ncbi:sporulation histidine kinase inhibitor Sda [Falsibacillus pallidus]|jgi:developmental checkpoint coupling sporulation initiation to replication initiation|uniref:Sporulation inhibitor A n=1 Tax=Falsibacillus pallidus TaxID=493781 RepID=A0A370GFR4_9BACI|nr:sporulation histidine kinase inhibitor Sda [Falsibacillus pallidus]RDI41949.1 sporulation inhibitor A [Falsibacillus pallidus]
MNGYRLLNDEQLMDAYLKAKKENLSKDFIKLLEVELKKRSLLE